MTLDTTQLEQSITEKLSTVNELDMEELNQLLSSLGFLQGILINRELQIANAFDSVKNIILKKAEDMQKAAESEVVGE